MRGPEFERWLPSDEMIAKQLDKGGIKDINLINAILRLTPAQREDAIERIRPDQISDRDRDMPISRDPELEATWPSPDIQHQGSEQQLLGNELPPATI